MFDLKAFREKNNFKQSEIAKAIGIQRSRLSKYENGKDQSQTISDLLLKHYPDIIAYELDEEEMDMDFKKLYMESKKRNAELEETNATLKDALEMIKKLINDKDQ